MEKNKGPEVVDSKKIAVRKMPQLFELLSEEERVTFREEMEIRQFRKGDVIYSESESPAFLLCLLSGSVKIYKTGIADRSQIVRVISPVQYFGYRAYFAQEPFVTNAAALENSSIAFVPMTFIEQSVMKNNHLAMLFIRMLATDLGIADKRSACLTQNHIRGRLADTLLFLRDNYGLEEDNATLSIYLTREDLASLSNMTTANAIRTLSIFSVEKLIAIDGRKIKIIDSEHLERIAKIG